MRLLPADQASLSCCARVLKPVRSVPFLALLLAASCGETDSGSPAVVPTTPTTSTGEPTPSAVPPTGNGAPSAPPVASTPPGSSTAPTPGTPPETTPTSPSSTGSIPTVTPPATSSSPDTSLPPEVTSEPAPASSEGETTDSEPPAPAGQCPASPGTAPSGTINATHIASVKQAENDYDFHLYEGPVWIDGALYFSDVKPSPWDSNIRRYVPGVDGTTDFLVGAGSNGLAVDANGVMHSATSRKKEISKYDLNAKTQTTAVPGPFNSPNDIAIASDGTIYFSDQQQGELPAGGKPQGVHVVKGGQDALFSEEIQPANGVLLSPEEDVLYVTITGNGLIKKATIGANGTAEVSTDFATGLQTPDGMTKDCLGNIYVAEHNAQQVTVFAPDGTKIAAIKTGTANNQNANPTNVAFGGSDGKTLFITASYSLWQAEMPVAGYPY